MELLEAEKTKKGNTILKDILKNKTEDKRYINLSYKKTLLENISDFLNIAGFKSINIPIICGEKSGEAFIYFRKRDLKNLSRDFVENYKICFGELVNAKKWIESEKEKRDIGIAESIARLFEDGDYDKFLHVLNEEKIEYIKEIIEQGKISHFLKLLTLYNRKFELLHLVLVKEEGDYYHILSCEKEASKLAIAEQVGLIKYSIFVHRNNDWKKDGKSEKSEKNKIVFDWINKNAEKFRKIFNECRINSFGNGRTYHNCFIFKNLIKRINEELEI